MNDKKATGSLLTLRDDDMGLHQSRHASGERGDAEPQLRCTPTAFLLYKNDVIKEDEIMNAENLPKAKMPNRDGICSLSR